MKQTTGAVLVTGALLAGGMAMWAGSTESSATATESVSAYAGDAWSVDTLHSNVLFKIRHGGAANFWGRFNDFSGEATFDADSKALEGVTFEIQVGSVDTKNEGRDKHLKDGDFFNARQFPTATFASTAVSDNGDGTWTLTGDMTLVGETNEVTATVYDVREGEFRGQPRMGFEAKFAIKRTDFGITTYVADDGGETGGLGNTVEIIVAVELAPGG